MTQPASPLLPRRTLLLGLLGAGAAAVSGCAGKSASGGGAASPSASGTPAPATPSGPIIHQQDAGTVVTTEDIKALISQLDAAVSHGTSEPWGAW